MASKFQKALSTNRFVGISVNLPLAPYLCYTGVFDSPHVEENLTKLFSDFEQRMQGTSFGRLSSCGKVVLLERSVFPCSPV